MLVFICYFISSVWGVRTRGTFWREETRNQWGNLQQDACGLRVGAWTCLTLNASSPFAGQIPSYPQTPRYNPSPYLVLVWKGTRAHPRLDKDWRGEVVQMSFWFQCPRSDRHKGGGQEWIHYCLPSRGNIWRARRVAKMQERGRYRM